MSSPALSDWLLSAARTVNGAPGGALLENRWHLYPQVSPYQPGETEDFCCQLVLLLYFFQNVLIIYRVEGICSRFTAC